MTETQDFYKEIGNEEKARKFAAFLGIELERAKGIFLDLFLYAHGIAVLTASRKMSLDQESTEKMMANMLSALLSQEKGGDK